MPIYENENKEKLINARELFYKLRGKDTKTKFSDWIKERVIKYKFIENVDYICYKVNKIDFSFFYEKSISGRPSKEYYLTVDTAKEICMIENNDIGRKIRRYFIEAEKRYREIISNPKNIFDFMRLALDEIEKNENKINKVEKLANKNMEEIEKIKSAIDIKIQNNYCLASDIAEQLNLYSENKIPHSNLIGAIARELGYKISYKHYYEDENIAIIKDISKNEYWQVYFKQKAVKEIINWFSKNKKEIYYEIQYIKNTKNGKKG